MNQELYKEKLIKLAEKDFENMEINFVEYMNLGLKYIGAVDPKLRDDLNLPFLDTIVYDRLISEGKIIEMLKTLSGDAYLFYNIDEQNSDAVFTRTFSALIIGAIVDENNNKAFLSDEILEELYKKIKLYLTREKDFRGFVTDKGWAHSAAHIADVIGVMAENENISIDKIMDILFSYQDMFVRSDEVFTHNENERIIRAVMNVYSRSDFDEKQLIKWIESIDNSKMKNVYPDDLYVKINSTLLLRSLYFSLLKKENNDTLIDAVLKQLEILE